MSDTLDTVYVFGSFGSPGVRFNGVHRVPRDDSWRLLCACDRPPKDLPQIEGEIVQLVPPWAESGWSFVSWYDRRGDARRGVTTGILARGSWTSAQLIEAGRRLVPWAFRVDVQTPKDES